MCVTYGVSSGSDDYLGIDFEFVLYDQGPKLSLAAGLHEQGNTGVDFTLLMSGQLGDSSVRLYLGLDSDYEMRKSADDEFILLGSGKVQQHEGQVNVYRGTPPPAGIGQGEQRSLPLDPDFVDEQRDQVERHGDGGEEREGPQVPSAAEGGQHRACLTE